MAEPSGTPVWKMTAAILLAVFVVWFIYSAATANDAGDCSARNVEHQLHNEPLESCD